MNTNNAYSEPSQGQSIFWALATPLTIIGLIVTITLFLVVPKVLKENVIQTATTEAERTVNQFKTIRSYYTKNIVKTVLGAENGTIKPDINHKNNPNAIPLPATMVHDLSEEMQSTGTSLSLVSPYPFPNRQQRKLDTFQQRAWDYLSKNPDGRYAEEQSELATPTLRVAIADKMVADACVNCHNSHPQTPKNGWKLGDVRGILEVTTEIEKPLAAIHKTAYLITAITLVALVIMLGVMSLLFRSKVSQRLNNLTHRLKDIASGDGDLTQSIDTRGSDELAKLSFYINKFIEKLRSLIEQIVVTSEELGTSSNRLLDITQQVQSGASEQQQETNLIASAVTQMAATAEEVNDSAANAAEETSGAERSAQAGNQVVEETVQVIDQLSNNVSSSSAVVNDLAQQAENIGSVVDVIRGIADQTNLLALNAAIEAARAGEQGRGFAVVADEVRTLASRTQESTEEINRIIESLQAGTRNAEQVMEQSKDLTTKTVESAKLTGSSIDQIASAITAINNMNNQIATAADEQQRTANSVTENVLKIQTISESTSESADSAQQACMVMNKQVNSLRSLLRSFKT